jgi:kexin
MALIILLSLTLAAVGSVFGASPSLIAFQLSKPHFVTLNDADALAASAASAIGGVVVGAIGSIPGAYLVSVPGGASPDWHVKRARGLSSIEHVALQRPLTRVKRSSGQRVDIRDPLFQRQWHLASTNATGLWDAGVTGAGVTVAIVDDGIEGTHADFEGGAFSAEGSWDFNANRATPTPRASDGHGTRCAGEVAARPNAVCGVGVAYGASVSGVRILGAPVGDAIEASALIYAPQTNDIYSCSWGPTDDGATLEGPGYFARAALEHGTATGRGGRGSVYAWAAGNGGDHGDNCNFDGYANSPHVLAIGAVGATNDVPYYSEPCAALLAVAYSSNSDTFIATTDVGGECALDHGGTSAAAPLAAGVYALALSVRPDLTWRDLFWLTARTAVPFPGEGETNAAGLCHDHLRGFGRIDAGALVEAARAWKLVPPPVVRSLPARTVALPIPHGLGGLTSTIDVPEGDAFVIERVQVTVTLSHQRRGDISIDLVSPSGVVSRLATPRMRDRSRAGFVAWPFSTVRSLGETPHGTWTLVVRDTQNEAYRGSLDQWALTFHGH